MDSRSPGDVGADSWSHRKGIRGVCSEVNRRRKKITAWLEEIRQPPFKLGEPPEECQFARNIWVMMDRRIDYAAMPVLCEMYGIEDVETLIAQLVAIREFEWPKR